MQEITKSEVLDARRLIRTFPQSPLIRSDSERLGILRDFIRLVDDDFEDVLDRDVDGWLLNFQTDVIMTLWGKKHALIKSLKYNATQTLYRRLIDIY